MLVHRAKLVLVVVGLLMGFAPSAQAAFHLWEITQLYSNASGSLQFIEMKDNSIGGNNFVNGLSIQSVSGVNSNTYTIPSSPTLGGNTAGHFLLFGTAGIQAAGGPAPDFIIPPLPANFLFTSGGTINYFALGSGNSHPALPTDGLSSLSFSNGFTMPQIMPVNIVHNYGGGVGTVNGVPEPSTMILTSAGACLFGWYRRRSRRRAENACPNAQ